MSKRYKGFEALSQKEMKEIKGGYQPTTGCVAICKQTYREGNNTVYAMNVPACDMTISLCASDHLESCTCSTVVF